MKTKLEKIIEKRLTVARMRQLLIQLHSGEITFSRMVEIINEESGSLLLKEVDDKTIKELQKVANKFIIEGVNEKFFVSEYGISKILEKYLSVLNK
jgi:hypothetical protein